MVLRALNSWNITLVQWLCLEASRYVVGTKVVGSIRCLVVESVLGFKIPFLHLVTMGWLLIVEGRITGEGDDWTDYFARIE